MIEQLDSHNLSRLSDAFGEADVFVGWAGIARQMVMDKNDASGGFPDGRSKDLSRLCGGSRLIWATNRRECL